MKDCLAPEIPSSDHKHHTGHSSLQAVPFHRVHIQSPSVTWSTNRSGSTTQRSRLHSTYPSNTSALRLIHVPQISHPITGLPLSFPIPPLLQYGVSNRTTSALLTNKQSFIYPRPASRYTTIPARPNHRKRKRKNPNTNPTTEDD